MSLEVRDLTVRIDGRVVVDGVSFTVDDGERVGLIGESGSGKSLTALAILGLLPDGAAATGSVLVDGSEVIGAADRDVARLRGREVGIVFQEPRSSLNPIRSLGRQLADPVRRFEGVSRRDAAARAVELARMVRLPDPERIVGRYPHQVSGGQLQRAAIALALAGRPRLLIADEPTTALDVTIQAEILDLFDRLVSELDTGLLFITHDLAVLRRIADRAVVLQNGRLVEEGSVDDLVNRPRTDLVRRLVESARATSWRSASPSADTSAAPGTTEPTFPATTPPTTPRMPGTNESTRAHGTTDARTTSDSTDTAANIDSGDPAPSTATSDPTSSTYSSGSTRSTGTADSASTTDLTDSTSSTDPSTRTEPSSSPRPARSTHPSSTAGPSASASSSQPEDSPGPAGPTDPASSAGSAGSTGATDTGTPS